jgi:class 3 adenylate cyclase/pimeloyl-ACP methyl ester carboxylesterase
LPLRADGRGSCLVLGLGSFHMDIPTVEFVDTDDGLRIAYQVFGSGPLSVSVPPESSSIEAIWGPGPVLRMMERTAANLRVALFDHRGAGLSDGFETSPTLAERALDIKAVMDATGMDRASLMGFDSGAQVAVAFAVEYPSRVDRLVLTNGRVGRSARAMADELAPGVPEPLPTFRSKDNLAALDNVGVTVDEDLELYVNPSLAKNPDLFEQLLKFGRLAGSRSAQRRQVASIADTDIVKIAPRVEAPTLIIHSVGNRFHHVGYARYLKQLIPDATLLELPGDDAMYWISDNWKDYVDAGITFVANTTVQAPLERRLAIVMFTDIVGSTATSVDSGDSEWRNRLDMHDRVSDRVVTQHGGTVVKNTGDGILVTFDLASNALDAALELNNELSRANISIRTGIHAGEIEVRGTDISGATVNLAARVQQAATDGRIYTTTTIRDMLIGSPYQFNDAGNHPLEGFDGTWQLIEVRTD